MNPLTKLPSQILLCFLLLTTSVHAQNYTKTKQGLELKTQSLEIKIEFYSPEIVRILKYPEGRSSNKESFSVVKTPETTELTFLEDKEEVVLLSSKMQLRVNLKTGKISYADQRNNPLLSEKDYGAQFTPVTYDEFDTYNIRQAFMLDPQEAVYGLGQQQDAKMNQRNQQITLFQKNTRVAIPYIYSTKGYALFWDNYSATTFTDNPQEMSFDSQAGKTLDYYFIYGKDADGAVAQMRNLTGEVPMNALWTYGFWQSRERYTSQEETIGVVQKFRELQIPIDGIVQDWQYWGEDNNDWNSIEFGNPRFSDPKKMIDQAHELNTNIIISVWPSFGPNTAIYKEFEQKNMLLEFMTYPPTLTRVYDAFNPQAREIYWEKMNKNMFALGMDGWWLDATEPSFRDEDIKLNQSTHVGMLREYRNAFPIVTVGGVHDNQLKTDSTKRVFILTRSAFAGQQRYGANVWSGDVDSSWEALHKQISAGVNFSICGMPYWNSDIGGFVAYYPDGTKNESFQELYLRWLQFGTFTPMMRSHGTGTPREIYLFAERGEWAFDVQERYIKLRYLLLPYLYSTAWSVTSSSDTFMRGLFMDFAYDQNVLDINDQYMFGRSFLVAPVTCSMYVDPDRVVSFDTIRTESVYLPQGADWYDFWTGEYITGGQTVQKETPIDIIPLYVRAGTILPIGPRVQYATEKEWDDLEIRLYAGADGEFTLYEDENNNYNYQKGLFSTIKMSWDDRSRTLTIADREGEFRGMLKSRRFRIVMVDSERGIADCLPSGVDKTVVYRGKELKIKL